MIEVTPKKRVTSARRKKNLSLLPTVPFDVLMEVRILYISSSLHLSNARPQIGVSTAESSRHHRLVTNFEGIQGPSPVQEVDFSVEGSAQR